jgi:hypothetical protein
MHFQPQIYIEVNGQFLLSLPPRKQQVVATGYKAGESLSCSGHNEKNNLNMPARNQAPATQPITITITSNFLDFIHCLGSFS